MADEQLSKVDAPVDEVEERFVEAEAEVAAHQPWHPTTGDILCIAGIALTIIRAWVSLLFVPKLIGTHPV